MTGLPGDLPGYPHVAVHGHLHGQRHLRWLAQRRHPRGYRQEHGADRLGGPVHEYSLAA